MKLVTFSTSGGPARIGAVLIDSDAIVDLSAIADDMRTFFELGQPALERAAELIDSPTETVPLELARLHAPIVPKKFFHTAGNYREHDVEAKRANFSHPVNPWIVFFQNPDAIIGPDDPIVYPSHLTNELDYEIELAVIIGRAGKHFSADEAPNYVAGYTIFNDITARDIQRAEMKNGVFSFCKAIDTFCPIGPWIVTPDELPPPLMDPHRLAMRLSVNGDLRQDSGTWNMDFGIAQIVAHYSSLGYSAGDIVSTGTVRGVAAFAEDPWAAYLKPGDIIEAHIAGIGTLRNPVVSWEEFYGDAPLPVATAGAYGA